MLHLMPAALHRAAYRLAHALRKKWWRLTRPHLKGCSVVAIDLQDRLLLVRLSYGSPAWTVPSGGVGRNETPEAAARREFREETGCDANSMVLLGVQEENFHGARNTVHVFATKVSAQPKADNREVVEARFFPLHSLPEPITEMTRQRLAMWRDHSKKR